MKILKLVLLSLFPLCTVAEEVVVDGGGEMWTMDGGTTYRPNDDFLIGSNMSFNGIIITNGASVTNNSSTLGVNASSDENRALVGGSGSIWLMESDLFVGESGSSNRLEVLDGGSVENAGGVIGFRVGSDENQVMVDGANSSWKTRDELFLGERGAGNALTVTNGATVEFGELAVGRYSTSFGNALHISGAASEASTTAAECYFGYYGVENTLVVEKGGVLEVGNFTVGYKSSSVSNRVTVTGGGSHVSSGPINTRFYIGESGSYNQLLLADGAMISDSYGHLGHLTGSTMNAAIVRGAGTVWTNRSDFFVGRYGTYNELLIDEGGTVGCVAGDIGTEAEAVYNRITVDGAGSSLICGDSLYVGKRGSFNALMITNGALVRCEQHVFVGAETNSNGRATGNRIVVTGAGSQLELGGKLWLSADGNSGNTLYIGEGGSVKTGEELDNDFGSSVTLAAGATADVNIYGQGADSELVFVCGSSAYGTVSVDSISRLDGTLRIELAAGYVPQAGDKFNLFNWGPYVVGSFSHVELPALSPDLSWSTSDLYVGGSLLVVDGEQTPFEVWAAQFPAAVADETGDFDGDEFTNWEEFVADTNPTNAGSYFVVTVEAVSASGCLVAWHSASNRYYDVGWAAVLSEAFTPVAQNLEFPVASYLDTEHAGDTNGFYQVEVRLP